MLEGAIGDTADDAAENDRQEGAHLNQGVAARQVLIGDQFRHRAIFRRAEKGGLGRQQEQDDKETVDTLEVEGDHRQHHGADFEGLGGDQHAALGKLVSQLAGIIGEQQVREYEDGAGHRQIEVAVEVGLKPQRLLLYQGVNHIEGDDRLVKVVVEGSQELRCEHPGKSGLPQQIPVTAFIH